MTVLGSEECSLLALVAHGRPPAYLWVTRCSSTLAAVQALVDGRLDVYIADVDASCWLLLPYKYRVHGVYQVACMW